MELRHSAKFKEELKSTEVVNYKDFGSKTTGVYSGFQATRISDISVNLNEGVLFINADNEDVCVKVENPDIAHNVGVSNSAPYIVCTFSYVRNLSNVPHITSKSETLNENPWELPWNGLLRSERFVGL